MEAVCTHTLTLTAPGPAASSGGLRWQPLHSWERSEEHTSELQSPCNLVCRLLLEKTNANRVLVSLSMDQAGRMAGGGRYPNSLRLFFFFIDPATTEIYTLSLHDALPISSCSIANRPAPRRSTPGSSLRSLSAMSLDRKSTRLNSSHLVISYAVFCLK